MRKMVCKNALVKHRRATYSLNSSCCSSQTYFLSFLVFYVILDLDDILTIEILERSTSDPTSKQSQFNSIEKTEENSTPLAMKRPSVPINIPTVRQVPASMDASSDEDDGTKVDKALKRKLRNIAQLGDDKHYFGSRGALPSPLGSAHSFDMQVHSTYICFSRTVIRTFIIKFRWPIGVWKNLKLTLNQDLKKSFTIARVNDY